jgi:hypothetical protein
MDRQVAIKAVSWFASGIEVPGAPVDCVCNDNASGDSDGPLGSLVRVDVADDQTLYFAVGGAWRAQGVWRLNLALESSR